jgi:ABC-type branched-subunit amino acid transport system substrate-binding protein
MHRRTFLSNTAAALLFGRPFIQPQSQSRTIHIAVLSTGANARARHAGALLGIEEADHAAELFGGRAELITVDRPAAMPDTITAILGDDALATARALSAGAAGGKYVFMNIECISDELRGSACSPFAFHVAPSAAMLRDALAQAPGATAVAAWDSTLFRFGADTLNDRFRKRFGMSMTSTAWTAWFAVKVLWESSLRMKSGDPKQIAEYLTRDTTQFDGHKGRALSFRSWDHQLRQFLYANVAGRPVDIPQSALPETTSREFLDKLGTSASATACRMAP